MTQGTFEVQHQAEIPEGKLIRAKLDSLEVVTKDFTDKKTGELKEFTKLEWIFKITEDGDMNGMTVRAETSTYLSDHPDNKFRSWAEGLLGRELDLGAVLSVDDLVGLQGLITVRYDPDRKDPSKKWRRVDTVISIGEQGDPPF